MGFSAVWITPIVDNPDEAFTGGDEVTCTVVPDRSRQGRLPRLLGHELLPGRRAPAEPRPRTSPNLTQRPAREGPQDRARHRRQPQLAGLVDAREAARFGQVFDADGHACSPTTATCRPTKLDPAHNPLQRWYNTKPDLAQLGDFNPDNPAVMDYLAGAYRQWIDAGRGGVPRRHDQPSAARVLEDVRRAHPRAAIRASSCSARPSTTTPPRSRRTPGTRTAATACSTSR